MASKAGSAEVLLNVLATYLFVHDCEPDLTTGSLPESRPRLVSSRLSRFGAKQGQQRQVPTRRDRAPGGTYPRVPKM